ncbi:hypothetical protein GCM10010168_17810 [Actinoplanes ianthinogenes]|uniref:DUF3618 domain-containing protein n=1 Tax=Actinoplanes ianthinogenes TaxID=122358 RepID=A0ABN6CQC1_9ACTN|nr:DUF3618 domain-containing protein [Actinoplanes ianthinogenes]BCJ47423.1 hypothetical protein Aiant_80800 [Actinoplanes ianthinogenes]GGR01697.1 hypothetical protein GCM10010168_17810 [Actinoplanes ianthinogenes]
MSDPKKSPDPDQLRAEIEQTRAELGETVEALAAKTDVKARVREEVATAKDRVAQAASTAGDRIAGAANTAGDRIAGAANTVAEKTEPARQQIVETATSPQVRRALPPTGLAVAGALAVIGIILIIRGRRA